MGHQRKGAFFIAHHVGISVMHDICVMHYKFFFLRNVYSDDTIMYRPVPTRAQNDRNAKLWGLNILELKYLSLESRDSTDFSHHRNRAPGTVVLLYSGCCSMFSNRLPTHQGLQMTFQRLVHMYIPPGCSLTTGTAHCSIMIRGVC